MLQLDGKGNLSLQTGLAVQVVFSRFDIYWFNEKAGWQLKTLTLKTWKLRWTTSCCHALGTQWPCTCSVLGTGITTTSWSKNVESFFILTLVMWWETSRENLASDVRDPQWFFPVNLFKSFKKAEKDNLKYSEVTVKQVSNLLSSLYVTSCLKRS